MAEIYDIPSNVSAADGLVLVDGPNGAAFTLTADAAAKLADRLRAASDEAIRQDRPDSG